MLEGGFQMQSEILYFGTYFHLILEVHCVEVNISNIVLGMDVLDFFTSTLKVFES